MTGIQERILALHGSGKKICLVATGAGAGCQNLIFQAPGASNTLLDCLFPYCKEALTNFLGFEPEKFVSEETSLYMAGRAWRRANEILVRRGEDTSSAMGVAVTGAIATNRVLRGEHRIFIAVRTAKEFYAAHVVFAKDEKGQSVLGRSREGELADIFTLNMILNCVGVEQVKVQKSAILGEDFNVVPDGVTLNPRKIETNFETEPLDPDKHVLFEGSFNPLHFGHERAAREVEMLTGKKVVFVLTDTHPDKGKLDEGELQARLNQFRWVAPVIVTRNLGLYVQKARAYPGFSFIIGADTLRRILSPKYYAPLSVEDMLDDISAFRSHFFVVSRHNGSELISFDSIRDNMSSRFWRMFTQLTIDIRVSSTVIRKPML
jgi:nicotinamide mononucleotide (NMN) deamidase PncC